MSMASVHPADISPLAHLLGLRCLSVASSLDKLANFDNYVEIRDLYQNINSETVLTIEQLRSHINTCFTCGVSWSDQHVSLDCSECGGYALERPCVECDGKCTATWKRDLTLSHASSKARWVGDCNLQSASKPQESTTRQTLSEICQRFEANNNTPTSS